MSDNCSSDGTKELVSSYIERFPALQYYRNTENLGFNGNMLKLITYAKGEYAWITGDDDVINLETFGTILNTLRANNYDYLSIGFNFAFKEDFVLSDRIGQGTSFIAGSYADVLLNNCFRGNTLATFMGSSIVRLSMFRAVDTSMIGKEFDCYYNCFPNAYMIATAFHNAKCAYTKTPYIICVSPKNHKKTYDNLNSWAVIDTNAIVGLLEYVKSLGVDKKYLKRTEERISFDYIVTGARMKVRGMGFPPKYFHYLVKAFGHPRVIGSLFLKLSNGVFKTKFVPGI